jgi:hypothetical protein
VNTNGSFYHEVIGFSYLWRLWCGLSDVSRYAWDFDRASHTTLETFTTFSVGIFQWQQKASGKGLKKSPGISRVLGYTAEPDRVYAKAIELCARLNREGAKATAPPPWLKKQYSISRPVGMVIERRSNDFTSSQVRAQRLKVMQKELLPHGFVMSRNATYLRRQGDQIHLINFQSSKYGHELTVNLGFHYTFIPPLFHQRKIALCDLGELDCIATERIGYFWPEKSDTWIKYGSDPAALIANLQRCARTCVSVFENYGNRWRDLSVFLADRSQRSAAVWHGGTGAGGGWVELKLGRIADAAARLALCASGGYDLLLCELLKEAVDQCKTGSVAVPHGAVLKDWVLPGSAVQDSSELDRN